MNLLQSGILSQEEFEHEKALLERQRLGTELNGCASESGKAKKGAESICVFGGSGVLGGSSEGVSADDTGLGAEGAVDGTLDDGVE